MNKLMWVLPVAALVLGTSSVLAQDKDADAKEDAAKTETGTVVTDQGWPERCILPLVVTAVDGKSVKDGDSVEMVEFEPGEHAISGYALAQNEILGQCATFSGENAVKVDEDTHIGQSSTQIDVVAGKKYFVGVDVRQADKKSWKVVTWKIIH